MSKEEAYGKIDEVVQSLGLAPSDKTVFEIKSSRIGQKKTLTLKSGSWQNKEPWFGIDENNELHTMVSVNSLMKFIESYQNLVQENFDMRLERSILSRMPIDFGDVWVVCMDEIQNIAQNNDNVQVFSIDLDKVVDEVKAKHPNLFLDLEKYVQNPEFDVKKYIKKSEK